jgi:hypothetical protein
LAERVSYAVQCDTMSAALEGSLTFAGDADFDGGSGGDVGTGTASDTFLLPFGTRGTRYERFEAFPQVQNVSAFRESTLRFESVSRR